MSGYDELVDADGGPRPGNTQLVAHLRAMGPDALHLRQRAAEIDIAANGVSFTVYADGENIDRPWPFDVVPRVFAAREWAGIEAGLLQRLAALNLFIDDLYHGQRCLREGIVPEELVRSSLPGAAARRPPGLGGPAGHRAVELAHDLRRPPRAALRRPAPLRAAGRRHLRHGRRPHPRSPPAWLLRRELVPGWRLQGHVDRRGAMQG